MSKRAALANVLLRSGLSSLLGHVESRRRSSLLIYAYHRILDLPASYHYDQELISASVSSFDAQVRWIAKNRTPLTFHDLLRLEKRGEPLPERPCIVTFDDGFFDNYRNAFRVLKKHSVPATFFVSTDYIGSEQTYWFDWLAHRVLDPSADRLQSDALNADLGLPQGLSARRQMVYEVLKQAKALSGERQLALIDELLTHQRENPDPEGALWSMPMDWDMVRSMSQGGMEIGSHGVNHYMLAKLDEQQLSVELDGSKRKIESEIDAPVVSIAYPVGGSDACDTRVFEGARASGYQYGCDYVNGMNYWPSEHRYSLARKQVELHVTFPEFVCAANLPWLY